MTALAAMRGRTAPLGLVIFDCDGVLVNSEPVTNKVVAEFLTAEGWAMTPAEADRKFLGMSFPDMVPMVEAALGSKVTADWTERLVGAVMRALATESHAIPGALAALAAVTALGLPWRVASNSSHAEMALKFACSGAMYNGVPKTVPNPVKRVFSVRFRAFVALAKPKSITFGTGLPSCDSTMTFEGFKSR